MFFLVKRAPGDDSADHLLQMQGPLGFVQRISHRPSLKLDSAAQQRASPGEECSPLLPSHGVMIEQLPYDSENNNGFSVYHSSSVVAQLSILRVAIAKVAQVVFLEVVRIELETVKWAHWTVEDVVASIATTEACVL